MQLTYKYKLKPTKPQAGLFQIWIELCRRQYNFRLGQRFDWYEQTRTSINACPLNVSIVAVDDIYKNIPLEKELSKGKRKGEVKSLINQGYVDWATSGKLIKRIGIVGTDVASLKTALGLSFQEKPAFYCFAMNVGSTSR